MGIIDHFLSLFRRRGRSAAPAPVDEQPRGNGALPRPVAVSHVFDKLVPEMRVMGDRFLQECLVRGLDVLVYCTLRTHDEQDALYAKGRTEPGDIVTNARGGQSAHNWGLAFDAVPRVDGKPAWKEPVSGALWQSYGHCAKVAGLEWGGDWQSFKDAPHCQMPNWRDYVKRTKGIDV
jgi:hypothetical protein